MGGIVHVVLPPPLKGLKFAWLMGAHQHWPPQHRHRLPHLARQPLGHWPMRCGGAAAAAYRPLRHGDRAMQRGLMDKELARLPPARPKPVLHLQRVLPGGIAQAPPVLRHDLSAPNRRVPDNLELPDFPSGAGTGCCCVCKAGRHRTFCTPHCIPNVGRPCARVLSLG